MPPVVYVAADAKAELAKRAREELAKRATRADFREAVALALRQDLFGLQLEVLDDPSPRIALCCSRRAGKSELAARMIAIALLRGGHNQYVVFAARTLQRARGIIWPLLSKINDDYALGWRMQEHVGQIVTPTGSVFLLLGVDDATSVEKVRGSKFILAVCDESSTYDHLLERLVIDCIEPGTIDLNPRGRIVLAGTPGYAQAGYWFETATGLKPGWKHYHWTLAQNPHIPNVQAALASIRDGNGWDESHPTYRREYLGIWVADENTLVYAVAEGRNTLALGDLPQPPPGKTFADWVRQDWHCTLGADVGYTDAFALSLIGTPPHSKDMYILETTAQTGLRADQQAEFIQRWREKYAPTRTVIDAGGQGKIVHQEFNHRYGALMGGPAAPAQKMGKVEAIGMFNGDLRTGRLRALMPACQGLYREWCELVWDNDEKTKVNKTQANHLTDATLYAWRAHRAWLNKAAPAAKTAEDLEREAQDARLKGAGRRKR